VTNPDPQYFLKPIGHSGNPVRLQDRDDFSMLHQNLHFSTKKPKMVKKGDIIITVGVGGQALLSYFKVTGGVEHVTDNDILENEWKKRWPWFLEGRNQSPQFGKKWWQYNIQKKDVVAEFLELYKNTSVTYAGSLNLNTLEYGNDKVKITKEFGDFLIQKIQNAVD
jgi:hypothetical protein